MSISSDAELITRYLNGDKQAFGELVGRYQDFVYNLSLRLVGNTADAEDLTQEIFIQLLRKVGSWRRDAKFSTWLYRLAANQCRDRLRRRRPDTVSLEDNDPPGGDDPLAEVEARELKDQLAEALSRLSVGYRLVVVLRDVQGLSYEEIAESLDISLGTVKSRLSRGRALMARGLRPILEQNDPELHQRIEG